MPDAVTLPPEEPASVSAYLNAIHYY